MVQNKKEYAKYIASLLLFGSNGIIAGQVALPSAEIVFWRTLIGSLLLMGIFCVQAGKSLPAVTGAFFSKRQDVGYVILSGVSMGVSWIFLYEAYALVGVSLSSLAYYCGPVIVMALSPVLFQEKLTPGGVTGFVIVFLGVVMMSGAIGQSADRVGVAYGLAGAAAYALMVIFSKKSSHIRGLDHSMLRLVCSFLTVMAYIGVKTGFALQVEASDWGWLLVLGLVNTGFGCYLYFSSMEFLSVQRVSVLGYLEPLSAIFFAVILLGERMTVLQWLGAALILGGAVLGEYSNGNQPASKRNVIAARQK